MSHRAYSDPLYQKLHRLPKIDLHTHLNGSISNVCLQHMATLLFGKDSSTARVFQFSSAEEGDVYNAATINAHEDPAATCKAAASAANCSSSTVPNVVATQQLPTDPASRMHYCFTVFDAIYKVMNNLDFTRVAIQDVLFHYAAENTVYLELRTSLRAGMFSTFEEHKTSVIGAGGGPGSSTQADYWRTVTDTVADCLDCSRATVQLPPIISPMPPFTLIRYDSADGKNNDYLEALSLWASMYGGSSSYVGAFVLKLAAEARASVKELDKHSAVAAMRRLRVRMLMSFGRGQPMSENEGTAALIPQIIANDSVRRSSSSPLQHQPSMDDIAWDPFPSLVGVDLSGSAYKGDLDQMLTLLQGVREKYSLAVSLHAGEKDDDTEIDKMIAFGPERWGHLVFLSEKHRLQMQSASTLCAVELCITSNLITSGSADVSTHHIHQWLECLLTDVAPAAALSPIGSSHISIHTDDRGVFATSMTKELWLLSKHTEIFPEGLFGPINSDERCEKIFPVLKAFHRSAANVVFAEKDTPLTEYRAKVLAHFDKACLAVGSE